MPKKQQNSDLKKIYGKLKGPYNQSSIQKRIEALFLDNVGKILTREQIIKVAINPKTGREPENWHQRLSELRTDHGYTILSWRNKGWLNVEEYLMPTTEKREIADKRVRPSDSTWLDVLKKTKYACQWDEDGIICGLKNGDIDPIGGGTVKLTPDHKRPHSVDPTSDKNDPSQWQVLCGRHQVTKKNYWDDNTGKLNVYAIIQAATKNEKERIFRFLLEYFGYEIKKDYSISKIE